MALLLELMRGKCSDVKWLFLCKYYISWRFSQYSKCNSIINPLLISKQLNQKRTNKYTFKDIYFNTCFTNNHEVTVNQCLMVKYWNQIKSLKLPPKNANMCFTPREIISFQSRCFLWSADSFCVGLCCHREEKDQRLPIEMKALEMDWKAATLCQFSMIINSLTILSANYA